VQRFQRFTTVHDVTTTRCRRPWRIAPAAAVLALTLAACGSADSDDAADTVAPTEATEFDATAGEGSSAPTTTAPSDGSTTAPAPTTGGDTAPAPADDVAVPDILQFSAPLVGGGTFDGARVAGIPTAFWFWAPT
jgi:hypothetical protein